MKSIIFCTSFIRDHAEWQERYQRWLDYQQSIPLNAVKRILIDDGSPFVPPANVIKTVAHDAPLAGEQDSNLIVRFNDNLGRRGMLDYSGWWRSFLHSVDVARELDVDKIIHIESDAFILSERLVDFINGIETGWHVLWAERYKFPETAIQVICRDQFEALAKFKNDYADLKFPDIAERILPFTAVHREFNGDRYAEFSRNRWIFRSKKFNFIPLFKWDFFRAQIPQDADFVAQRVPGQQVRFRRNT